MDRGNPGTGERINDCRIGADDVLDDDVLADGGSPALGCRP
jgi:hypothetical protein